MVHKRKALKKVQRQESASQRNEKVVEIMDAQNDSKTFHKLIKQQRKTSISQTQRLVVDGKTHETAEEICSGWCTPFQKLAIPLEKESFDEEYKAQVDLGLSHPYVKWRDSPSRPLQRRKYSML